ncbi:FAD:protein FMN transferase [Ectothiorhodospiraceae bacterium WFHF3C12]|nr:FAD:protein FMN transferase [Ectothiorhodospiraceae bacterium WFHF3C12]
MPRCRAAPSLGWKTLLSACLLVAAVQAHAEWIYHRGDMMGTSLRLTVWHADRPAGESAIAAVIADMQRINALMSPYVADSELSRLNSRAAGAPVAVSPELIRLLQQARAISELTGGAFDVTYASVGHLYDYRRGVKPDRDTVDQRLPAIDYRHVTIDPEAGTVRYERPGVRIDLGGIAKGYAVERAADILRQHGVGHAQVSLGGDTRLVGDHRGRPWVIGIRDPRDPEATAVRVPLVDEAVSTSGDYERYFEEGGIRYHHIIDPDTGQSADAVQSVTILGPNATRTDAFSTSVFVMGVERGLSFINARDGFEAVIVDSRGTLHYSAGLRPGGE